VVVGKGKKFGFESVWPPGTEVRKFGRCEGKLLGVRLRDEI